MVAAPLQLCSTSPSSSTPYCIVSLDGRPMLRHLLTAVTPVAIL
jgi:hypothetical protein